MKMTPIVSIIMGSTSDLPVMEKAAQLLNDMHVPFEMTPFLLTARRRLWKSLPKMPVAVALK